MARPRHIRSGTSPSGLVLTSARGATGHRARAPRERRWKQPRRQPTRTTKESDLGEGTDPRVAQSDPLYRKTFGPRITCQSGGQAKEKAGPHSSGQEETKAGEGHRHRTHTKINRPESRGSPAATKKGTPHNPQGKTPQAKGYATSNTDGPCETIRGSGTPGFCLLPSQPRCRQWIAPLPSMLGLAPAVVPHFPSPFPSRPFDSSLLVESGTPVYG